MIDTKTDHLGLPLPHEQNDLDDDVLRIRAAFRRLDEFARATDDTLAARLAQAVAADDTIATLLLRMSAAEEAQEALDAVQTEHATVLARKIEGPPTAERRGAIRVGAGLHLATGENGESDMLTADVVSADGVTTQVDEEGILSALGGHLLLNSEAWITESGEWVAPVLGWYALLLFGGGSGAYVDTAHHAARGGASGKVKSALVYLARGESVPVVIGAGTAGMVNASQQAGGETSFGDVSSAAGVSFPEGACIEFANNSQYRTMLASGGGLGGGKGVASVSGEAQAVSNARCSAVGHYGGGGGVSNKVSNGGYAVGAGAPGSVRVRWHDTAKAAGPLPAPVLFAARRMARAASSPPTVNLYDPETGQGSVWREEDAPAKLAEGLITEDAWLAICAERAAEAHAAWLADPETVAERFEMLRATRDACLTATDYLVAPDYPLSDTQRGEVTAYRQALRDLPAQAGAPWDGGGEGTPWPEMPDLTTAAS